MVDRYCLKSQSLADASLCVAKQEKNAFVYVDDSASNDAMAFAALMNPSRAGSSSIMGEFSGLRKHGGGALL